MTDHDKNPPAFPGGVNQVHTNIDPGEPTQPGMTLRDYFAAKAMQSDFGSRCVREAATAEDIREIAALYYRMADAMLAARNEPKKDE